MYFASRSASLGSGPKPIIGVASSWNINNTIILKSYINSVFRAGGIPMVLPISISQDDVDIMVQHVDAVILPGGGDIDPVLFHEEPHPNLGEVVPDLDTFNFLLINSVIKYNKTLFAICRGMQILNVYFGGTLYQDIPAQFKGEMKIKHKQEAARDIGTHYITINDGTNLKTILNQTEMRSNSFHHQAIKDLAQGFRVTCVAKDGMIEGIEKIDNPRIYGVQFHPEGFVTREDDIFLPLFQYLVHQAQEDLIKSK